MNDNKYLRNIDELAEVGSKWWPKEVREMAAENSIMQILLATQERFLSILKLSDRQNAATIFGLLDNANFSLHLFLKHLSLLTDVGAEPLQRINASFFDIFPSNVMEYSIEGVKHSYKFLSLPLQKGKLDNKKMQTESPESLLLPCYDKDLSKDIIMLLIFGGASTSDQANAILYRSNVYEYLGNTHLIDTYVRQNYIRVSKIIGGKTATDLGNVAQSFAADYLRSHLGKDYNVRSNATIPHVKLDDDREATFDIVVDRIKDTSKYKPYVGIEVSFQETSNSTVERKGREAQARFQSTNNRRSYVAYIIDGVGNFSRRSAVNDMCNNSHCNVAYTRKEFDLLIEFIKEKLG